MQSNEVFYLSIIYAHNTLIERRPLWSSLLTFQQAFTANNLDPPWVLLGDFNVSLKPEETSGNQNGLSRGMLDFKDFLFDVGLTDLYFTGMFYTWWDSNRIAPLHQKLDRVLVNSSWLCLSPVSRVEFKPRGISNHSPAMVSMSDVQDKIKKPFQVFNHIIDSPAFSKAVKEAWDHDIAGDPWFVLTSKLKRVKTALISLFREGGDLHVKVMEAKAALLVYQESIPINPSSSQFIEEETLCADLRAALHSEEIFLKQKSRITWLKLGDGNNGFFFRACKGRWNSNKILALTDESGNLCTTHSDISNVAVRYYQDLLGTMHQVSRLDPSIRLPCMDEPHLRS